MTTMLLILGLATVFVGVAGALAAAGAIGSERTRASRTLATIEASGPVPESMRTEIDPPFSDRVLVPLRERSLAIGRWLTPDDYAARVRRRLDLAGNPVGWDAERVLAAKVLWGGALGGVTALLSLLLGWGLFGLIAAAGLAVLGYFGPDLWLNHVADKRSDAMRRALPDSLDLLTISVEAGLAFDAAMSHVATSTTGPLAEEFQRTLQEMQLGTRRQDALRAMAERTHVDDLEYIVSALVQADAFGIPIGDVLRVQADEMRLKRSQRAEEAAAKMPVKILFPLLFGIMPATLIVIIGPAVIRIVDMFAQT